MSFDHKTAQSMIDKYILVGVNRYSADGTPISTEQIHGRVLRVSEDEGVAILLNDSSEFSLPPLLSCYQPAEEGIYTLKSTNEQINNPDYVATFNVTAAESREQSPNKWFKSFASLTAGPAKAGPLTKR